MKQNPIGPKLKKYRIKNDLTFDALSGKTGVDPSTLYRIENELVDPNERTIYKLVTAIPELKTA